MARGKQVLPGVLVVQDTTYSAKAASIVILTPLRGTVTIEPYLQGTVEVHEYLEGTVEVGV